MPTFKSSCVLFLLIAYFIVSGTALGNETDVTDSRSILTSTLDWVNKSNMTDDQKAKLSRHSCGAFIDPLIDDQGTLLEMEDAPLVVYSEDSEATSDSSVTLKGDVQISQGNRKIRANTAMLDQGNRQVSLKGNVQFREPGLLLIGQEANIDIDNRNVVMDDLTYVIHEASLRGYAKNLNRTDEGKIKIIEASYSTCEPGDSSWKLITDQIEIDQDSGWATVKNARLDVKDIPIFFFPYLKVPIDQRRSSGLLFPDININTENGLDITQPIYWNLAPNYDATIAPRVIEHRGFGLEAKFRYLNKWSINSFSGAFLGNDSGGRNDDDIDLITGLRPFEGEDRYRFSINHFGGSNKTWSSSIDYHRVSDIEYVRDLGNMNLDEMSKTHLKQQGYLDYSSRHWNYRIGAEDYQIITRGLDSQYSVIPYITANGYYHYENDIALSFENQYAVFKHDDPSMIEGIRSRLDYGISWNKQWSWGYVRPEIQLKHLAYKLKNYDISSIGNNDESPNITVPIYSFDTGIFLEKDSKLSSALLQTFEPRIFYLNSSFKDQSELPDFDTREFIPTYNSLFQDNRFVGGDRISDDKKLTIGFTTRFLDKSSGEEQFRASIAQSIFYRDRRVKLNLSPMSKQTMSSLGTKSIIALETVARMNKEWRFIGDLIYNEDTNQVNKTSLTLRYKDKRNRLFNFSYRYTQRGERQFDGRLVDQDLKQTNLSAFIPLSSNFNLVGRWSHDFTFDRELEIFAGFEYNNCCWRASVIARRWLDRDDKILFPEENLKAKNGISLKIEFKGLAGSGSRLDTILKNGIYGYEYAESL